MTDTYPTHCRTCTCLLSPDSVYWIPSANQWFRINDLSGHRKLDTSKMLGYCPQCYIDLMLNKTNKCLNCGIFTNTEAYMHKSTSVINGNVLTGDYKFIIKEDHLIDKDGGICMECLDLMEKSNIIEKMSKIMCPYLKCAICEHRCDENNINVNGSVFISWNQFSDQRYFFNGFSSEMELSPPLEDTIRYPCQICDVCMEKLLDRGHTISQRKRVECHVCHNFFSAIFSDINQGDGCASYISEQGIFSHFGSKFDTDIYKWKTGLLPNALLGKNNCCDDCVQNMIDNKIIEYFR